MTVVTVSRVLKFDRVSVSRPMLGALHCLAVCTPINVKPDGLTPRGRHAHCSASVFTSQPEDISSQVQPCYSIQTWLASYFKLLSWHRTSSHFCVSVRDHQHSSGSNTRCYVYRLSNSQAWYLNQYRNGGVPVYLFWHFGSSAGA